MSESDARALAEAQTVDLINSLGEVWDGVSFLCKRAVLGTLINPEARSDALLLLADRLRELAAQLRRGGALAGGWSAAVQPLGARAWRYTLAQAGTDLVACWLCAAAAASDALWEEASAAPNLLDEQVTLHRPRGVPWLAVALLPGVLTAARQHLLEAGDAERCVAWAILARG